MSEHTAENDAPFVHRMNVNIAGSGARPIVTLWCGDCLVSVRNFDQVNDWSEVQQEAADHCSRPSERERLTGVVPPGGRTLAEIEPTNGRHHRNGHLLELSGCMWRCLQCHHVFDAAVDAERFWCGDDCTSRHPGDPRVIPPGVSGVDR